jgi:hypothetical protein
MLSFKSPEKKYRNFKSTKRPFSPSPKRADYEKVALIKPNGDHCTYILESGKRCKMLLGLYPRFCHFHTLQILNLYIDKSKIPNAGNGLFSGLYGFKKGMIIGEYSENWMNVKETRQRTRNGNGKTSNDSYLLCAEQKKNQKQKDILCWDALDIRSTITRNANDGHGSQFRNNAYFKQITDSKGKIHIYMVSSRNIAGFKEILCDYGPSYF